MRKIALSLVLVSGLALAHETSRREREKHKPAKKGDECPDREDGADECPDREAGNG